MAADNTVLPNLPDYPKMLGRGQAQAVNAPAPNVTGLAAAAALAAPAAKTLKAMPKVAGPATRGAAEADIYRRISPSVVLILNQEGLGSGSVIGDDGTILTNAHVVGSDKKVGVIFKPEIEGAAIGKDQVVVADVVKVDATRDLALVKVQRMPERAIPAVKRATLDSVKIGDDAHAIGHPTGQTWTYTKGYVSQIRRAYEWNNQGERVHHKADVIQTQTPINPGNSGGPLLNAAGELIGVNAFKGEGESLNYAIAVSDVETFLQEAEPPPPVESSGPQPVANTGGKSACQPHLLFEGRNKENDARLREFDIQCHGNVDLIEVLPDDTSKPMFVLVDLKETGKPNGMVISKNRDGFFNISYWDTTGSGKWDTIGYHPDGKIVPSSYGPYIPQE